MRLVVATIIGALFTLAAAQAGDSPVARSKITLKTSEVLELQQAMNQLDGHSVLLKDGDKTSMSPAIPWKFKGGFLWAIAIDHDAIAPIVKEYQDTLKKVIAASGAGKDDYDANGNLRVGSEAGKKVADQLQGILDTEHDLSVIKLSRDEFKLGDGADENAIPPSVLHGLRAIVIQPSEGS